MEVDDQRRIRGDAVVVERAEQEHARLTREHRLAPILIDNVERRAKTKWDHAEEPAAEDCLDLLVARLRHPGAERTLVSTARILPAALPRAGEVLGVGRHGA